MYSIFSCAYILCSHFVSIFFVPVNPDKKNQVVWFGTHAIVNFTISWYTFMSVYYTFSNPQKSGDFEYQKQLGISKFPMCLSIWIHIYHAVFYNLSQEDMFHHAVFVTLLPVPGYNLQLQSIFYLWFTGWFNLYAANFTKMWISFEME